MAARILKYTQCQTRENTSNYPVDIVIRTISGTIIPKTIFASGSTESLSTIVNTGSWDRRWILTNTLTREVLTGTSENYALANLSCGNWINTVELIDRTTKQIVSIASNTITIECSTPRYPLSLDISADPLSGSLGKNIDLSSRT